MKKISIILKDITEEGGGERVCANLANALSESYEIEIVSLYKSFENTNFKINKNIPITYLSSFGLKNAFFLKKIFLKTIYRYYLSLKICKLIKQNKTDIVIANDGFFVPFFKMKNSLRIWHLDLPKKEKRFSRFDTLVILSSKQLLEWQKYHKNIKVIPNFLPFIPEKKANLSQKVVLSVGRLTKEKGFFRLIEIWDLVQKQEKYKDWKLHIVGSGKLEQEIKNRIKEKNLQDCIELKPFTKEIEKEYLSASIYVMTSFFEGFGMVLIEAGSYALPCIAFDINTGPSDIIENEKTGFLIKDNELEEFASKLCFLMDNENLKEQMGKAAKLRIQENFSKEIVMKQWEELFRGL